MAADKYMEKFLDTKFNELHQRLDRIEVMASQGVQAHQEISKLQSNIKLLWTLFLSIPVIAAVMAFVGYVPDSPKGSAENYH